jgi:hypothetical protein
VNSFFEIVLEMLYLRSPCGRFRLSVTDDLGNVNTDETSVTVNQDENAAPVARAGEDFSVFLPLPGSVVKLNGSASSDDFRIVRWLWTRETKSLAAGNVIGGSNKEPVMLLTDLVAGQYTFTLQVGLYRQRVLIGIEINCSPGLG